MKRKRRQLLEVEAMLSDYERRLTNSDQDQFRPTAIPGARTMKAKDAARINELLDDIVSEIRKAGGK
jgi:hypothetical protein